MATMSRTNMLVVATLVTTAVLGGAYALGHALGGPGGPLGPAGNRSQIQADHGSPSQPDLGAQRQADHGEVQPDHGGQTQPDHRNQPAIPAPARTGSPEPTPAGPPSDNEDLAPHGPAQLPAEPDGPFGARLTTGSRYVALTFDDGPDPRYTPQALAILRDYQVKATFCLVGSNAQAHPQLVRAIAADGHTLCNHSWDHDVGLGRRSAATIRADLTRTNEAIRAAVPGARIAYYRQPGGAWTPSVVAAAQHLGMTSLHWTVDPEDWTRPGAGQIVAMVTASASPGAIVLLHDAGGNRQGTVNALHPLLISLSRRFGLVALPTGQPPVGTPPANDTPPAGTHPTNGTQPGGTPPANGTSPGGMSAPNGTPEQGGTGPSGRPERAATQPPAPF